MDLGFLLCIAKRNVNFSSVREDVCKRTLDNVTPRMSKLSRGSYLSRLWLWIDNPSTYASAWKYRHMFCRI